MLIIVRGDAVGVRGSHIHKPGVFTGSTSISRHSSGPALAIARGASIRVLQGLVMDVRIGVGLEGPNSADLFVHVFMR